MKLSNILQVAGAVLITAGIALFSVPVAVIAGGVFSLLFGIAMERINAE